MTVSAFESALTISGGSTSSGRLSSTRDTRSRTSFAAASMSRDSTNSTVMRDRPSDEDELTVSMPSTPLIASSMTCVTRVSTTLAAAPR